MGHPVATTDVPMVRYRRISKWEAMRRFKQDQPVLLCPHKMRPDGPFSMASLVFGREYLDRAVRVHNNPDPQFAWELMYNNWAFYNASHETGYYPHYYVEESRSPEPK